MTPSSNAKWIELVHEVALEPELPIIDPHHHLWDFREERVAHRYLMDEITADINCGHNIVATVYIECSAMMSVDREPPFHVIGETEFVNGVAAMSASGLYGNCRVAAGIVGTVDLRAGDQVGAVLDAHISAGGGRFRGIRVQASWDPAGAVQPGRNVTGPDLFIDADFQKGFAELASRNLSFEAWCYHTQISQLAKLARAFPNTTIVLDHFGGPLGVGVHAGRRDEIFQQWKIDIAELAACENVVAKLGGINMELNGFDWHLKPKPPTSEVLMQSTRHFYEYTIEQFGIDRCMFESNFPVDMCSCSYTVLWNSFKRLTAGYSNAEKSALYHDNASRIYRLAL